MEDDLQNPRPEGEPDGPNAPSAVVRPNETEPVTETEPGNPNAVPPNAGPGVTPAVTPATVNPDVANPSPAPLGGPAIGRAATGTPLASAPQGGYAPPENTQAAALPASASIAGQPIAPVGPAMNSQMPVPQGTLAAGLPTNPLRQLNIDIKSDIARGVDHIRNVIDAILGDAPAEVVQIEQDVPAAIDVLNHIGSPVGSVVSNVLTMGTPFIFQAMGSLNPSIARGLALLRADADRLAVHVGESATGSAIKDASNQGGSAPSATPPTDSFGAPRTAS